MSKKAQLPAPAAKAATRAGFTLIELIAVLAILGVLALITYPALSRILLRERIEGFLRSATLAVERAKGEAAKRNLPVVVRADFTRNAFYGFCDLDRDSLQDTNEGELFFLALPAGGNGTSLRFWAAGEAAPQGDSAVTGFSADPTPGSFPHQAILDPDGSARSAGAFRFGYPGNPGNFYELRIEPAATARVQLRKYLLTTPPAFMARNPQGPASWPWY